MIINSKLVVMKSIIYVVFLLSIILCPFVGNGMAQEKKDTGKNKNSAYQKLFNGKNVKTAKGVMTIHYTGGMCTWSFLWICWVRICCSLRR